MSAVDFEAWTLDGLDIMLRGSTFTVEPPSTGAMGQLYALAAQAEVELRLALGPVPDEVTRVIAAIGPDEHPALGVAWQQMVDAGINPVEIDRAAVYSIFYWTHGKEYATAVATLYFAKAKPAQEDASAPKSAAAFTAEEWAQCGQGEPIDYDVDGIPIFADYNVPRSAQAKPEPEPKASEVDVSAIALVSNWRAVVAALVERGIDLYDPAVRARPWPGIRTLLFSIIDSPSPLRGLLTRR